MRYELTILEYYARQIIHLDNELPGIQPLPENWQSEVCQEGQRVRETLTQKLFEKGRSEDCWIYIELHQNSLLKLARELELHVKGKELKHARVWYTAFLTDLTKFIEHNCVFVYEYKNNNEKVRCATSVPGLALIARMLKNTGFFMEEHNRKIARVLSGSFTTGGKYAGEEVSVETLSRAMGQVSAPALKEVYRLMHSLQKEIKEIESGKKV